MSKSRSRNRHSPSGFGTSSFQHTATPSQLTRESKSAEAAATVKAAWIAGLVALLIATVSGIYVLWMNRPALSANILVYSWGVDSPVNQSDSHWSAALYVALTNNRELPVSPANYVLKVSSRGVPVPMVLDYVSKPLHMGFVHGAPVGVDGPVMVTFPERKSLLTYEMTEPITKAKPRYGLLRFRSESAMEGMPLQDGLESELLVVDSAGNSYVAGMTRVRDFQALYSYEPTMQVERVAQP